jgi:hypothetical protein
VKRSGRDEPIWVVIHMCMEAMLGISLNSNLYLNLAKMLCFFIIAYVFSSTKLKKAEQVLSGSEGGRGRGWGAEGEMDQKMYAHMNK